MPFALWLALVLLTVPVRADEGASEPAPEPQQPEQEKKGFDEEADYLALADAPIFLPRSYLYWGTPVGPPEHRRPLVFALQYALHLPV